MTAPPEGIEALQFETAVPAAGLVEQQPAHAVTCSACQQPIASAYYDVNGQPVCQACEEHIAQHLTAPRGAGVMTRALLFGVGAAIVGAVIYFAVVALTGFEVGIAAIAIGYLVGYAMRRATGGRGGRRFQVAALLLTYWAVGLAYTPLVIKGAIDARRNKIDALLTDAKEVVTVRPSPATIPAPAGPSSASPDTPAGLPTTEPPPAGRAASLPAPPSLSVRAMAVVFGLLFVMPLVLPVLTVMSSLPGGLLSGAIIAFGMKQAWSMTGALPLVISGPYRIAPPTASI